MFSAVLKLLCFIFNITVFICNLFNNCNICCIINMLIKTLYDICDINVGCRLLYKGIGFAD